MLSVLTTIIIFNKSQRDTRNLWEVLDVSGTLTAAMMLPAHA